MNIWIAFSFSCGYSKCWYYEHCLDMLLNSHVNLQDIWLKMELGSKLHIALALLENGELHQFTLIMVMFQLLHIFFNI